MHVVIFEGQQWHTFAPLSLTRPVFALSCGMTTLLEKQVRHLKPTRLTLWVRPAMVDYCMRYLLPKLKVPTQINVPLDDEPAMIVSGRTLHFRNYHAPHEQSVAMDEGNLICAAYAKMPGLSADDAMTRSEKWLELFNLPQMQPRSRLPEYLWDLIAWNEESLIEESTQYIERPHPHAAGPYHMINPQEVWLDAQAKLSPGVVLDASKGAIVIAAGASIGPNAVLQGPCYVGPFSTVAPLALIRPGVSVGTMCKVAGEISNSIILSYTNKAHDGFLGDSYLGEFVNLGAGTTTSNLKNTYGPVEMRIGSRQIPSGRQFLGSIIGDHAKTAIGTRLMTGTYIGVASMLAASKLPPKFIPSFTFWTDRGAEPYQRDKLVSVIKTVFARRHRQWEASDDAMLSYAAEAARIAEE